MRRLPPLPLEEIVRAQNLAAAGASVADIARELGRPVHAVMPLVDPDAVPVSRPKVTRGYADVKNYYR